MAKKPTQHDKLDAILAILTKEGTVPEHMQHSGEAQVVIKPDPTPMPTVEEIYQGRTYYRAIIEAGGVENYIAQIKGRKPNYPGDRAVYPEDELAFIDDYLDLFK